MVFRSLLGPQTLAGCLPHLIRHLPAESIVVHSYAACSLEKILTMRDANNTLLFGPQVIGPHSNQLVSGLFATLSLTGSAENEYVMKGEFKVTRNIYKWTHSLIRLFLLLSHHAQFPCAAGGRFAIYGRCFATPDRNSHICRQESVSPAVQSLSV